MGELPLDSPGQLRNESFALPLDRRSQQDDEYDLHGPPMAVSSTVDLVPSSPSTPRFQQSPEHLGEARASVSGRSATVQQWADLSEGQDEPSGLDSRKSWRFETSPDENGVKTVVEYEEREGSIFKITRRVRLVRRRAGGPIQFRFPPRMPGSSSDSDRYQHQSEEGINIEPSQSYFNAPDAHSAEEDAFYEASV